MELLTDAVAGQPDTTDQPVPAERPIHHCRTGRCGRCLRCLDEAKWERIFAEKFADPTYYEERMIRHSSPLA